MSSYSQEHLKVSTETINRYGYHWNRLWFPREHARIFKTGDTVKALLRTYEGEQVVDCEWRIGRIANTDPRAKASYCVQVTGTGIVDYYWVEEWQLHSVSLPRLLW